jgi:hypothetical protein
MRHATQLSCRTLQARFSSGSLVTLIPSACKRNDRPAADLRLIARLDGKPIAWADLEIQLEGQHLAPQLAAAGRSGPREALTRIIRVDPSGFRSEISSAREVP